MNDSIIIPFCIWHYIDLDTQTFLGYIGCPRKYKKDGFIGFDCGEETKSFNNWFLAGTFYAVSPSFRPIPVGMKIFCAKKNMTEPYNTNDVYLMYDPYNIKDDCVYFITYNQPVPNTVPLYFHAFGDNIFPSFDPKPPSSSPQWSQTFISPIFVMTKRHEKFKSVNARCIPWSEDIPDLYDTNPNEELLSLQNCVIFYNELVVSKNNGRPFNILEMVADQNIKSRSRELKTHIASKNFLKGVVIFFVVFAVIVIITIVIHKINLNSKKPNLEKI